MASFLDALMMGLQGAGAASVPEEDIKVTARPTPSRSIPEDVRSLPVSRKREVQQEETPELIKRKGRFGVSGTLRDILGTVGDAYLLSNGQAPIYQPRRDQERLASAQYGFTDDPKAAAERAGELDAEAGRDLWKTAETVALNRDNRQSQIEARQAQVDDRKYKMQQDFSNYAARILNAADTPAKQAEAIRILSQRALISGLSLDDLGIPTSPTDEQRQLLGAGDMSVNQQQQLPLAQERVKQGQQNADANTVRANRPPQPRAQPNPTAASIIAPLADKIRRGQTLTPGEQRVYDDLRPSRGKSKRSLPALPPGFK